MRLARFWLSVGLFTLFCFFFITQFLGMGFAQTLPLPSDLLTPGATAWFVLLFGIVVAGVKFVQFVVAFLKVRFDFLTGWYTVLLSLAISSLYVLFLFQPGIMNVSALELLPMWQAYLVAIIGIWLSASGGKDVEELRSTQTVTTAVATQQAVKTLNEQAMLVQKDSHAA